MFAILRNARTEKDVTKRSQRSTPRVSPPSRPADFSRADENRISWVSRKISNEDNVEAIYRVLAR
jgi:hypothetical protein